MSCLARTTSGRDRPSVVRRCYGLLIIGPRPRGRRRSSTSLNSPFREARYQTQLDNRASWIDGGTWDENMAKQSWGFMPGCSIGPGGGAALLAEGALAGCPDPERVAAVLDEARGLSCRH